MNTEHATRLALPGKGTLEAATLAFLAVRPAAASDPPAPAVDPSGAPAIPSDVQKVLTQIGDLNLLKMIAPLQLTPDQIDAHERDKTPRVVRFRVPEGRDLLRLRPRPSRRGQGSWSF